MKAVKFCTSRDASLVCFTTGSGKSLINIATGLYLTNTKIDKFLIVVTASSIIELAGDFKKFTDGEPMFVKTVEDLEAFAKSDCNIGLVQYTWLNNFVEFKESINGRVYCKALPEVEKVLNLYVFGISYDEVHTLKNYKSKVSKAARALRKHIRCCYGFTATPLTRELLDVYYVAETIHPGWFSSYNSFCSKYLKTYKVGTIKKIYGYKNLDKLNEELGGLMITYFPEKKINFVKHTCNLTKVDEYEQAAMGLFEKDEDVGTLDDLEDGDEGFEEKTFSARLVDLQYIVDEDPAKHEKFMSVINSSLSTGVIVYCAYHRSIAVVESILDSQGIEYMKITGAQNTKARQNAKDWFNNSPQNKVLILSKAGGQSLNLQACPTFVFYETPQNPASLLQALGRVVRIGSAYDEFFIHFIIVEDTVDQYKYDFVSQNKEVFEKVMNNNTLPKSDALSGYNTFIIDKLKKKYLWNRNEKNTLRRKF